jgi:hypothetical protein
LIGLGQILQLAAVVCPTMIQVSPFCRVRCQQSKKAVERRLFCLAKAWEPIKQYQVAN